MNPPEKIKVSENELIQFVLSYTSIIKATLEAIASSMKIDVAKLQKKSDNNDFSAPKPSVEDLLRENVDLLKHVKSLMQVIVQQFIIEYAAKTGMSVSEASEMAYKMLTKADAMQTQADLEQFLKEEQEKYKQN